MLKIAITGNIACGKSTVGKILKELGIPVIDCDHVVHQILSENEIVDAISKICTPNIVLTKESLNEKKQIDRQKLGKLVFEDEKLRKKIEELVHPKCFKKIDEFFEQQKNNDHEIAVNLIPLLFETNSESRHDKVWLIYCDEETRLERFKARNPELSIDDLKARIASQMSQEKKKELSDFIIDNSDSKEQTKEQILQILSKCSTSHFQKAV